MKSPTCECGSRVSGLIFHEDRYWCADCIWKKMDALQATVDKLRRTDDGVVITEGMKVYHPNVPDRLGGIEEVVAYMNVSDVFDTGTFSTQELAEAAQKDTPYEH